MEEEAAVTYFFTPLVLLFMPEQCHEEFFVKFNFFDVPCLKIAVSKALGYGIILGSIMVKIPQIVKLIKAGSGVGLSLLSLFMEMLAVTFTMSYAVHKQFPFSSWGEALFMTIQNVIIVTLIYYYNGNTMGVLLFTPVYASVVYALCSSLTPIHVIIKLQEFNLVIMLISRFLQVWANFSNGHTGQLSLLTVILLTAGSIARVFTTLQETGDWLITSQYILSSSMNALILTQIVCYWNAPLTEKKTQ